MQSDKTAIDAVAAEFFDAFTNRNGADPNVDALYRLFLPEGIVVNNSGDAPQVFDLAAFVEPRRALLTGGGVTEFCEKEVAEKTEILGNIAQRVSRYRKSWIASERTFEGGGTKAMQLVKTPEGWKIAALAWFDET